MLLAFVSGDVHIVAADHVQSEKGGWNLERLLPYFLMPTSAVGALYRPDVILGAGGADSLMPTVLCSMPAAARHPLTPAPSHRPR